MKTLIRTNEFGNITKSFYNNEESANNAAGSFLRDCRINRLEIEKRTTEVIDFEFEKYGFNNMPIFAQYESNNLGLFIKGTFMGLGNSKFLVTKQVESL